MDFYEDLFDLNRDGQMDGIDWAFMDSVTRQARQISKKVNCTHRSSDDEGENTCYTDDMWCEDIDWDEE